MNTFLISPIVTERLVISRAESDFDKVRKYLGAVRASLDTLKPWVLWAHGLFNNATAESYLRACQRNWLYQTSNDIGLVLWLETNDSHFVGNIIIWNIDWKISKFELGYWGNQLYGGYGYISEAVNATTRYLIRHMHAARVEIRTDKANARSAAVAKRVGFQYEGCLMHATRDIVSNELSDVEIFGCIQEEQLKPLNVKW